MKSLWELAYLLEPVPVTVILTTIAVTFASASRALNCGTEMERNRDLSEASIALEVSGADDPNNELLQPAFDALVLFCLRISRLLPRKQVLQNSLGFFCSFVFGIEPPKELCQRRRYIRFLRLPSELGRFPVNLLNHKSSVSNLLFEHSDKPSMNSVMSPSTLLLN
ncbi:unnamed protein product [Fraxinus pennsylvanica]|uniref:Uncharacterized protein n=1 Tax=Fraxinus pennsylvanica TaxID=56036 RepID=A0AAD1ZSH8_9LAMI|nr:unnamed protein product [Fraxinus pennsylvanica]